MRQLVALKFAAVLAGILFGSLAMAHAQRTAEETYDQAINEALLAHESQRWLDALGHFERAHALAPSARTLRGMGLSAFEAGMHARAVHDLEAAMVHSDRPLSAALRRDVQEVLRESWLRVAGYRLRVQPETAQVTADGQPPLLGPNGEILLGRGDHYVEVAEPGFVKQALTLTVHGGERVELSVTLAPVPEATNEAPAGPASGTEAPPSRKAPEASAAHAIQAAIRSPVRMSRPESWEVPEKSGLRMRRAATAASVVSGVSLVSSLALYLVVQQRVGNIVDTCERRILKGCDPAEIEAKGEQAHTPELERAKNVTLVTGVVSLAIASVLWTLHVKNARRSPVRAGTSSPLVVHF